MYAVHRRLSLRYMSPSITGLANLLSTTSNIIQSNFEHVDISLKGYNNLPDMLLTEISQEHGNRTAFIDGSSGLAKTFQDLKKESNCFANGLVSMGIKKGDCVAIMSPTHVNYFTSFVGIALTGAFSTPINPLYTESEINFQLNVTQAKLIISHSMCLDLVKKVAKERNVPVISIDYEHKTTTTTTDTDSSDNMVKCIDSMIALHPSTSPNIEVGLDDTLTVPFSSGTSGRPKGVLLTHRSVMTNIMQLKAIDTAFNKDTVLMSNFDLEIFLKLIEQHRVTRSFLVPPILLALAKHPLVDKYDMSSLIAINSGAAPLGEETARAVSSRLKCLVKQGWGMTELSPLGSMIPDDYVDPPTGTSGMLLPRTEALILDVATGNEIPFIAGQGTTDGELLIRGPQVMHSYFMNEEATLATIRQDKFMHTGDIARFDKDGFLFITDRLKELIKYKGFQVAPAELEAVINSMDEVKDCIVIPVPDDEAGEIPRAYVVPKDSNKVGTDQALTGEQVVAYVAERVAPYKKLRGGVVLVDAVPKSASGKLLRRVQIELDRAHTAALLGKQ